MFNNCNQMECLIEIIWQTLLLFFSTKLQSFWDTTIIIEINVTFMRSMSSNVRSSRKAFFDHDFGYSFPFHFPPNKRGKKKRRMNNQSRGQKLCLSARSIRPWHIICIRNKYSSFKLYWWSPGTISFIYKQLTHKSRMDTNFLI